MAACTATFTACNSEESLSTAGNQLQLSFGINAPESRAIFTDTKLPDGKPVGVRLDGYADYANLVYTGTTSGSKQTWTSTTSVTLTDTKGTLYAYWPQSNSVSIDAIDVDMTAADQTDWLYATPVTDVNKNKASVAVTMNHALANINVKVNKGTYKGAGAISNITLQSDGIALGGTFNAAQTTPGYTAFEDEGKPLSRTVSTTAGAAATDIMVVPTGTSAAVTFLLTIDGIQFTAKSDAVQLAMGNSYQYMLNLSDISTYMEISGFAVKQWTTVTGGALALDKVQLTWGNAPNGVYAVSAEGLPVTVANADESCIAVALVVNDAPEPQRLMIEKMGNYNKSYTTYYWGYNLQGTDVSGFTGMSQVGGGLTGVNGYLGSSGNYGLNQDYTTWTSGALSDFDGKGNTADMFNAYSENNQTMKSQDICLNLSNFNDGYSAYGNNQGYPDWYVPACGQLALMCLNMAEINTALTAIGGNNIASDKYWSTTEYSTTGVWCLDFYDGEVMYEANKFKEHRVRFVRDVGSTISFTINEVTCHALPGMTWAEWVESIYNPNENVYVINGNYIYHIGAMSMDEIQGVTPGDVIVAGQHYTHNVYTRPSGGAHE